MKRPLTAEQQAQRDERRARFAKLAGQIAALSPEQQAEMSARMPVVTVEGRTLSVFNACLIASQCPSATMVGGFRQWLDAGRCVRKGEHGLMIWCPTSVKSADGAEGDVRFIPGTVFDVSQTDAAEQRSAA